MDCRGQAPRLYVALATVPGREFSLQHAVASLLEQQRPPDRLLVVAPPSFTVRKQGNTANPLTGHVNLSSLRTAPGLETHVCERDDGPGTKLLCALPRVLALARGALDHSWIVVGDDDRVYNNWALARLQQHICKTSTSSAGPRAFSFYTKGAWFPHARGDCFGPCVCTTRPPDCRKHCCFSRMYLRSRDEVSRLSWLSSQTAPDLVLGQGADLFAIPLRQLQEVRSFFDCAVALETRISRHDDFWISAYLKLVHNMEIGQVPAPHAPDGRFVAVGTSYVKNITWGAGGRINRRARRKERLHDEKIALHLSSDWPDVLAACAAHWDELLDRCANISAPRGTAKSNRLHLQLAGRYVL